MSIEKAKKMLQHLIDHNMAWCFDEMGTIWTRETLSLYIQSPTAWANRN